MSCEFCSDCKVRQEWESSPKEPATGYNPCGAHSCPVTDSWWGKYVARELDLLQTRISVLKSEIDVSDRSIGNLHKKLEELRASLEEKTRENRALRVLGESAKILETLDRFDSPAGLQKMMPAGTVSGGHIHNSIFMKGTPHDLSS